MENTKQISEYLNSEFYKKYEGTYYGEKILKFLQGDEYKKRLPNLKEFKELNYEEVYNMIIKIFIDFLNLYYEKLENKDSKLAFEMIRKLYIDPDDFSIKNYNNILCSADGLLSIKRIYSYQGITKEFIEDYRIYRKVPIIYFPKEKNGINMARATAFGDRIDYTLLDIKKYLLATTDSERQKCKLIKAYELPITKEWLKQLGNFKNLIDWLNIKGIFTNRNYEVYDIEKGNDSILNYDYDSQEFIWKWSNAYYSNLKKKIDKYMEE